MRINKDKFNYYGFNHKEVDKKFKGDLTYVGTFCIKDESFPVAVYHAASPDTKKGHKAYMLLQVTKSSPPATGVLVRGMTKTELYAERHQQGIQCPECKDIIYSVSRHDFRYCECQKHFIDGGRDYLHGSVGATPVMIDLVSGEAKLMKTDFRSKRQKEDGMFREAERKRAREFKARAGKRK